MEKYSAVKRERREKRKEKKEKRKRVRDKKFFIKIIKKFANQLTEGVV